MTEMTGQQSIRPGMSIIWIAAATAAFGVVMVYDASAVSAALRHRFDNPSYFFQRQLLWYFAGLTAMFLAFRIPVNRYQRYILPVTLFMLLVMLLVLIPGVGHVSGGARRWIRVGGFSVQPGEFMRLVIVLYLAQLFSIKTERISEYSQSFLPAVTVSGAAVVMLAAQPKFGSALVLIILSGVMFFIAGIPVFQMLIASAASTPLLAYAYFKVDYVHHRIQAWLHPDQYLQSTGFQTVQSLIAIGSGSLFGTGLGQGRQKMFYLPEAHTDMIFPVIAEELGLIGALILIGCFCFFLISGYQIARSTENRFGQYLAVGLTASILIPFFMNIMVVTGLFPVTGIALPLISYGGTALVTDMLALGILAGIGNWTEPGKELVILETC